MISIDEICDVSCETRDALAAYEALILKWTQKINLISRSTTKDVMGRHIVDSAQFWPIAPDAGHWVDLGSGGGLPGIVVAILAKGAGRSTRFTLVESDQRKATFLRTAARELKLANVSVQAQRIEALPPQAADIVSARALAPLSDLLPLVARHLAEDGTAILAKGESAHREIEEARGNWRFDIDEIASRTRENACLLRLRRIERA